MANKKIRKADENNVFLVMPDAMTSEIKRLAEADDRNRQYIIKLAIQEYLDRRKAGAK